jgi:hypothetical protein
MSLLFDVNFPISCTQCPIFFVVFHEVKLIIIFHDIFHVGALYYIDIIYICGILKSNVNYNVNNDDNFHGSCITTKLKCQCFNWDAIFAL